MDYLAREGAPISAELWQRIDETVIIRAHRKVIIEKPCCDRHV